MNPFRKTLSAAVAASAAFLAVASAAQGANAQPQSADLPWCTSAYIDVKAHNRPSPSVSDKLFWIRFTAKEGAYCKIGGSLSNVRFVDTNGNDVGVSINGPKGAYVELPIGDHREAAVYVSSKLGGKRIKPAGIIFNLPGKGRPGDVVKLPWPSDLGESLTITDLMSPVS